MREVGEKGLLLLPSRRGEQSRAAGGAWGAGLQ